MAVDNEVTISVATAGIRFFGLSRNASYKAAERGDIPTVRVGRLLRVPVRAMERRLEHASEPTAWSAPPAAHGRRSK